MLASRGLLLCRVAKEITKKSLVINSKQIQPARSGHAWSYRVGAPPHSKKTLYTAEAVGAFMWWWILWHLWHEPEHITGEFPYPDPALWTDEELGIPADDAE